jgi:hypothetical protein
MRGNDALYPTVTQQGLIPCVTVVLRELHICGAVTLPPRIARPDWLRSFGGGQGFTSLNRRCLARDDVCS